jgi:RND family efflux transporter MFP subunit
MSRRLVLAIAAATLTAAVAIAVSRGAKATTAVNLAANNPGDVRVTLTKVSQVKSAPREEITGALQPAKALQLGFEVGGRLARILVRKGATVGEGQIIAQLDPEMADAQVQQAEAAASAAQAQFTIAADVAGRNAELQKAGTVSDLQNKSSASSAASAAAQLQAARAQLAQARAARRRHDLKAPFAGVLIEAPDQVGATVAPGASLFTLEQLDPLVLKLTVSDSAREALKIGAKVHVESVGAGAVTDEAWVRTVIPSADPATRRIPVELVVPNKGARFTAHTLARAILPMGDVEDALSVPASALSSQGGDHVYVVAGESVRRIAVQVLERGAEKIVLKSAQPMDKVVNYPAPDLVDGARVSVK